MGDLQCCNRPMNPMRAGTGTPPRMGDEMWCDTCGKTIVIGRGQSELTEAEEQAFRVENAALQAVAAPGAGTSLQQCGECHHRWIGWPGSTCPKKGRHPTPEELSIAGAAADDAERRYQARERGLRSAQRALDAAIAKAEHERLNPPMLYRGGDGPPANVVGLTGIPNTAPLPARQTAPDAFAPENKPTLLERRIEALAQEIHAASETPSSLPVRQAFSLAGRFRVYFNRHQAAPLVWCIALEGPGGPGPGVAFEVAVAEVVITSTFGARTVYRPKATPDDEDGMPSAWLEVDGVLRVDPATSTARIG